MFWKPKKAKIINRLEFPIYQRPPIKKYFKTMHQIIDNAISYDENGENEICKSTLEVLRQHIDNYGKQQIVKPEFPKDRPNTTSTLKDLYNTRANEPKKTRN